MYIASSGCVTERVGRVKIQISADKKTTKNWGAKNLGQKSHKTQYLNELQAKNLTVYAATSQKSVKKEKISQPGESCQKKCKKKGEKSQPS